MMRDIKEISQDLKDQDSRCTARPFLILLQEKVERIAYEGCGDDERFFHPETCCEYKSVYEFRQSQKDNGCTDEEIAKYEKGLLRKEITYEWKTRAVFFTDKGYKEHLALNAHNYRGELRSYLVHCFRNPEMETVQNHLLGLVRETA